MKSKKTQTNLKGMNKIVQDLNMDMQSIKKKCKRNSGNQNFLNCNRNCREKLYQKNTREVRETFRIEGMIEKMNTLAKENVKSKILLS